MEYLNQKWEITNLPRYTGEETRRIKKKEHYFLLLVK